MGMKYLFDSNILIKFQSKFLTERAFEIIVEIIDSDYNISVISELEVLGHHSATSDVEEFIGIANIIDLTWEIRKTTIQLRKQYKIKLPDAIIAATAIVNKLVLITENEKDFRMIGGLQLLNPINI
jgi:predicted nucleic acid-binding protein